MKHNVVSFSPIAFALLTMAFVLVVGAVASWLGYGFGRRTGAQQSDAQHQGTLARLQAELSSVQTLRAERASDETQAEKHKAAIESMVMPMQQRLAQLAEQMAKVDQDRQLQAGEFKQQLTMLSESTQAVSAETARMRQALRRSEVRGRWGEDQLKRVLEAAGLMDHVHFTEQDTVTTDDGLMQRPDLIVKLSFGGIIVVDSKVPLDAALAALEAPDEAEREDLWKRHAKQFESHVKTLAGKKYWERYDTAPEVVVMFVPLEGLVDKVLETNPGLIDWAMSRRVAIVTPTSLYTLLATVGLGWRQVGIAENALAVQETAQELTHRLTTFGGHWANLAKGLDAAVKAYNSAVGSYESRVMPSARKLAERAQAAEPAATKPVETAIRPAPALDLRELPELPPTADVVPLPVGPQLEAAQIDVAERHAT